jgi:polysaccharide pyruvyl transferase WcaK-like protein
MAKFMGMRVMLYGNGIGPLTKTRNIEKARKALNICDYISLRDPESLAFIKSIGVENPNIALSIDPVFSLEPEEIPATENEPAGGSFVISLRPWQHNEPAFVEKMAEIINYTAEKYSLTPILIPLQMMDVTILRETAKRLTCENILHTKVHDYKTIMAIISRAEFAICMRLHALIYAVSVGLPIIGLVYDPKVANFISYMNENSQVSTSAPSVSALKSMVDNIQQNPAAAKEKIAAERERLRKLAGQDAQVAISLLR